MDARSARRRPVANEKAHRRHKPDYILLLLSIVLLSLGLVVVYAISPGLSAQKGVGENYYVGKQLLAVTLGIVAFLITSNIPITWWRRFEKPLIIAAAVAAIAGRRHHVIQPRAGDGHGQHQQRAIPNDIGVAAAPHTS